MACEGAAKQRTMVRRVGIDPRGLDLKPRPDVFWSLVKEFGYGDAE